MCWPKTAVTVVRLPRAVRHVLAEDGGDRRQTAQGGVLAPLVVRVDSASAVVEVDRLVREHDAHIQTQSLPSGLSSDGPGKRASMCLGEP